MILGIDLGTTNSLAGVVKDGKVQNVMFDDSKLLPSVITFDEERGLMIGQKAKNQYYIDPENSVRSIKRLMGTNSQSRLGEKDYLPEEVSGMILKHIKIAAEKQFETAFPRVVITVPAYFSDDQRKATALAGEIAGFKVERIINEPTAASLAYNYNQDREIRAIVYDFGGGTFDVSVVNISRDMVEVISSHGDNQLGGDDIDLEFCNCLSGLISEKYHITVPSEGKTFRQLLRITEKCKIELSDHPYSTVIENLHIDDDTPPLAIELEVERLQFEEVFQPFVEKTMKLVDVALKDAGLNAADIDQILLVGGTSKIPLVTKEFGKIFDIAPSETINPDLSVCFGAAVQGAIINDDAIGSILVDVTPYSFGTRAVTTSVFGFIADNDVFVPVIRRNSPLPASKSELFRKLYPDQELIEVEIYQGENEKASENKLIGSFKIQNLSRREDAEEIVLSMNLDLNGILTVVATEKKTGKRKQITIDNSFNREDISKSIDKLAGVFGDDSVSVTSGRQADDSDDHDRHPDKESPQIAIARTMIERAEEKMKDAEPEDADDMMAIIKDLKKSIVTGDVKEVEALTDRLTDILFYL